MLVITDEIKNKVEQLSRIHRLSLVLLFGSQVSGKVHRESDVDIGYLPEQPLGIKDEIRLNYELTLILRTDRVDTVNLRHAPGLLLKQIADQGVVLYEKTGTEFAGLEIYALRRFLEARPLFEIRSKKLDEYLKAA